MGMEERKGLQVVLIILRETDPTKAFTVGKEVAGKTGSIFNGLNVFTFMGNPPRDKQTLGFFTESDDIGPIVGGVAKALGLSPNGDFLVQALQSVQFVPRTRPPQTAS